MIKLTHYPAEPFIGSHGRSAERKRREMYGEGRLRRPATRVRARRVTSGTDFPTVPMRPRAERLITHRGPTPEAAICRTMSASSDLVRREFLRHGSSREGSPIEWHPTP
jgi:hypothetical protein